ncbi:bifunctional oligoribonuclease/PAP phosphatase NrnA [Ureibacillus thermophilus]|uniref:Bifunctional oligoribonuclease/PAP phosphatase NrnA n=1 Tax=Ureibacillus thermophilus TaxID=367743 RepID=A0A4P6UWR2_9BACL|nr:bifunctional oligoribonuclease/PAP phosphatase NrnA [Ureibacillus thermophilus]QBK26518.1 bifunctional oligoribonuclease/PAP phosphatase NrnA [Ureibacillus thermophilus]
MKRQIIDTIEQYDTIIIHRHIRPDPDAYGSQLGLKALIQDNYPNKKVYAAGTHDETLSYLGRPDIISNEAYHGALVIVTDTANTGRIDDERYSKGAFLIKIDHHPNDDAYGELLWVNTKSSSCSEMIYELYEEGRQYKNWQMTENAARFLFAGIVGDTGRFLFPSTTKRTFEIAGELIQYPFNRNEIFNGMYEMEENLLKLQGYVYQNFTMDENGAAYIKMPKELLKEYNVTVSETSSLVGSLSNIKGVRAWAIFVEEDNEIRVRLRSKGPVVNELAKKYHGGGHPLASGATAYSWEEVDRVIADLKQLCKEYQ